MVFGYGTHYRRALETPPPGVRACRIVDSDAKKHGHTEDGVPIMPVESLAGFDNKDGIVVLMTKRRFDGRRKPAFGTGCPQVFFSHFVS